MNSQKYKSYKNVSCTFDLVKSCLYIEGLEWVCLFCATTLIETCGFSRVSGSELRGA